MTQQFQLKQTSSRGPIAGAATSSLGSRQLSGNGKSSNTRYLSTPYVVQPESCFAVYDSDSGDVVHSRLCSSSVERRMPDAPDSPGGRQSTFDYYPSTGCHLSLTLECFYDFIDSIACATRGVVAQLAGPSTTAVFTIYSFQPMEVSYE